MATIGTSGNVDVWDVTTDTERDPVRAKNYPGGITICVRANPPINNRYLDVTADQRKHLLIALAKAEKKAIIDVELYVECSDKQPHEDPSIPVIADMLERGRYEEAIATYVEFHWQKVTRLYEALKTDLPLDKALKNLDEDHLQARELAQAFLAGGDPPPYHASTTTTLAEAVIKQCNEIQALRKALRK